MSNLSEGDSFLISKLSKDRFTDLFFTFFSVLYSAAGPVCVYFDAEILILFEVLIKFESQIMFTIPQ
jgi:hypothetical protein